MPRSPTKSSSYQSLISDIVTLYSKAQKIVVKTYWEIGKRIVEEEQKGDTKAPYGEHLIERLSEDLSIKLGSGFSTRNLERMRKLYIENQISARVPKLRWGQQIELLTIKDLKTRKKLEKKVVRENLTREATHALIQKETPSESKFSSVEKIIPARKTVKLTFKRGKFFTYSLADKNKTEIPKGKLLLDLGFDVWHLISQSETKAITITPKPDYTYCAIVEKVIDGDTLWVQIDCGFDCVAREKLRLRGIDAPEVDTEPGKKAQAFVRKQIPVGSLIVIRTYECEKFGRYLADIFYLPDCQNPDQILSQGIYLNQELLDLNLAEQWVIN